VYHLPFEIQRAAFSVQQEGIGEDMCGAPPRAAGTVYLLPLPSPLFKSVLSHCWVKFCPERFSSLSPALWGGCSIIQDPLLQILLRRVSFALPPYTSYVYLPGDLLFKGTV
jgi:hypothetical protein